MLTTGKVRELLAGRVPDEEMDARAAELLERGRREAAGREREHGRRHERARSRRSATGSRGSAAAAKRPRHLILVETARDQVGEDDLAPLNELRRRLDAGELGAEGFDTALRLGGDSIGELKRIVFRPAPRDD